MMREEIVRKKPYGNTRTELITDLFFITMFENIPKCFNCTKQQSEKLIDRIHLNKIPLAYSPVESVSLIFKTNRLTQSCVNIFATHSARIDKNVSINPNKS